MTTSIARADLLRFLEATGHPARIKPVAGAAPRRGTQNRDRSVIANMPVDTI